MNEHHPLASQSRRPPPTRFARRGIARLAYETAGEGETTVLLLHDLLADRSAMRPLRDALAGAGFRVVAPDMRGHGASAAVSGLRITIAELTLDLLAILDAEGSSRTHVVGIGLGATVGLDLALVVPERVHKLACIDPNLPSLPRDDADPEVRAAAVATHAETATIADLATKGATDRALDRYFTLRHGPDWRAALPKSRLGAIRRHANAFGPLLHALNDYRPTEDTLCGAPQSTLILLHEDLPELDRLAADRLRDHLTSARLTTITGSEAMASAIVRFLEQDAGTGRGAEGDRRSDAAGS